MKNLCSFCLKLEEIEILACNHTICASCGSLTNENKINSKKNCPFVCGGSKSNESFNLKKLVSTYFNMFEIIKYVFSNEKSLITSQILTKINILRDSILSTTNDSETKTSQISENLAKKIAEKNLFLKKSDSQKTTTSNEIQKNFSSENNSKASTSNLLEIISMNSENHQKNISVQELNSLKEKICRNQLRKTIMNNTNNINSNKERNKNSLIKNENQLFSTMSEIRKHFSKATVEMGSPKIILNHENSENFENKKRLSNLINLNNIRKKGRKEMDQSNEKTETLNQSSFTNFSALQERNIIQKIILEKYQGNIDFINKFDEESLFVVNADWWRKWTDYVNFESNLENIKGLSLKILRKF